MRISELANKVGVAPSALRYYEEAGLLAPAPRTASGYRVYGADAVGRLQFIQRAKTLGLSMREIRQLLNSSAVGNTEERAKLRHVVAHKLAETRVRVAELDQLRDELERLYVRLDRGPGPECGHVGDCACWLPTQEEVITMAKETESTTACSCCGCECPGTEGHCSCCGCSCP
jgi:MerR family copper efflux transcriptional regulator